MSYYQKKLQFTATMKVLNTLFTHEPITGLKLSAAACDPLAIEYLVDRLFNKYEKIRNNVGVLTLSKNLIPLKEKISPLIYEIINNHFSHKVKLSNSFTNACAMDTLALILDCCMQHCKDNKNGRMITILKLFDIDNDTFKNARDSNLYPRRYYESIYKDGTLNSNEFFLSSFKSLSSNNQMRLINNILLDSQKPDCAVSWVLKGNNTIRLMVYQYIEIFLEDKQKLTESQYNKIFKNTDILEVIKLPCNRILHDTLIPKDKLFEKLPNKIKVQYLLGPINDLNKKPDENLICSLRYQQYLQDDRHIDDIILGTVQLCKKQPKYIALIINIITQSINRPRHSNKTSDEFKRDMWIENFNHTKLLNKLLRIDYSKSNISKLNVNQIDLTIVNQKQPQLVDLIQQLINKVEHNQIPIDFSKNINLIEENVIE